MSLKYNNESNELNSHYYVGTSGNKIEQSLISNFEEYSVTKKISNDLIPPFT